mgnify:FL=1
MKQGRAIHETLANHYIQKRTDNRGYSQNEIQDAYEHILDKEMDEYEKELEETKKLVDKDFLAKEKEITKDEMLDAGTRGLAAYYTEINPKVQPEFVEQEFSLETNQNISIKGWIDLTDTKKIVHETKTSRKTPNIQEVGRDPQLAIYQIGYKKLAGKKPLGFSKDFIILGKREAKIERFRIRKPDIDPEAMLRYIWNIVKAIQNNIWYCVHPANSWVCSKDWCGYWKLHQELRQIGFETITKKYGKNNN